MTKLQGKTALVTGASRGIGRAIAARLAADGAQIIVNYARSADAANSLVREIEDAGGKAFALQADVSVLDSIDAMWAEIGKRAGGIDILVNNAGGGGSGSPAEVFDGTFDLNVRGLYFVTMGALPLLRDGGRIVTISSVASRVRLPGLAVYAASKAAADAFTRIWASELAPRGVTVNSVQPGLIETELLAGVPEAYKKDQLARIPMGRFGTPNDIADVVAFLASDDARWITGAEIVASGGQYS